MAPAANFPSFPVAKTFDVPVTPSEDFCVAVITRTKDRPSFLARAIQSVKLQTHSNWHLYIVNDGGEACAVDDIVRQFADNRISVIRSASNIGMEAASNLALSTLEQEPFFAMHDDDDSWHPDFLTKMLQEISKESHRNYVAIACRPTIVNETFVNDRIEELNRAEWPDWMENVELSTILTHIRFQIIAS
jgi:glycosyltransferase involved in cell wall biosynthesis